MLTFFDAHMEVTEGWLQPLLARIANDRSVITVPLIDLLSPFDMRYYSDTGSGTVINGFIWTLLFKEYVFDSQLSLFFCFMEITQLT